MQIDSLVVEGEKILSLIDALKVEFSTSRYISKSGSFQILIFEKYYLRTKSNLAGIVSFDFEDSSTCRILIAIAGGGTGIAQLSWGSEGSLKNKIREYIEEYAKQHRLKIKNIDTDSDKQFMWPYAIAAMTKCVQCGKQIHLNSKKCGYCGARQPDTK
jgi:hypothetical protein